jgi:transaldolase
MRFFLDSANLEEIRTAASWGVLSGVTTNPSLVAKEGKEDFPSRIRSIAAIVDGPVSAEVTDLTPEGMLSQGRELAALAPTVVVKIPLLPEGLGVVRRLAGEGIRCNVTLVFSPQQALLAAAAGAAFVSPFVGRLDDIGEEGIGLVEEIAGLFSLQAIPTEIIAASIRHPRHVAEAARAGAHVATVPFGVLRQCFGHPLTEQGIRRFVADWEARGASDAR